MIVSPEPVGGGLLDLVDGFKNVLVQEVITHRAVIALHIGVLLWLAGLD